MSSREILVPTGGSAHSRLALQFAGMQAAALGAKVTVLAIVKSAEKRAFGHQVLADAEQTLREWVEPDAIRGKLRIGHPAEEAIAEAEDGPYYLMVVGHRQHGGLLTRFVLGSTAQRIVEHSPIPVVVAKGVVAPVRRILLCDSGVEDAPVVDLVARDLPELMRAAESVTVLHVMSFIAAGPGVLSSEPGWDAEVLIEEEAPEGKVLARDQRVLAGEGVEPVLRVRHGLVVEEVAAEALAHDLVVIGAHRGAGWRRLILGDLAHQILTAVERPVLIVPLSQ